MKITLNISDVQAEQLCTAMELLDAEIGKSIDPAEYDEARDLRHMVTIAVGRQRERERRQAR